MRIKVVARATLSLTYIFASFCATSAYALDAQKLAQAVRAEEQALQARVGMAVFDTNSGKTWQYRGDERFPLNSTHKAFGCAAVLAKVDGKSLSLDQAVSIPKDMLVPYSPITEKLAAPKP